MTKRPPGRFFFGYRMEGGDLLGIFTEEDAWRRRLPTHVFGSVTASSANTRIFASRRVSSATRSSAWRGSLLACCVKTMQLPLSDINRGRSSQAAGLCSNVVVFRWSMILPAFPASLLALPQSAHPASRSPAGAGALWLRPALRDG